MLKKKKKKKKSCAINLNFFKNLITLRNFSCKVNVRESEAISERKRLILAAIIIKMAIAIR